MIRRMCLRTMTPGVSLRAQLLRSPMVGRSTVAGPRTAYSSPRISPPSARRALFRRQTGKRRFIPSVETSAALPNDRRRRPSPLPIAAPACSRKAVLRRGSGRRRFCPAGAATQPPSRSRILALKPRGLRWIGINSVTQNETLPLEIHRLVTLRRRHTSPPSSSTSSGSGMATRRRRPPLEPGRSRGRDACPTPGG